MSNTCKVNVPRAEDKRGPLLLWQAMAMCLEESPPREQLRITPISLLDSPSQRGSCQGRKRETCWNRGGGGGMAFFSLLSLP